MFGIDDALLAPIVGSAVGGLFGGDGGSASQTVSKDPWIEAAPWLKQNIKTGQDLQAYYAANPFNALQQNAYQNLFAGGDYINSMVPGLLTQFSQHQGFDRSNPTARPAAIQFPAMGGLLGAGAGAGGGMTAVGGLLGNMNTTQNPFANGGIPATPAPTPAPVAAMPMGNRIYVGGKPIAVGYDRETYGGAA